MAETYPFTEVDRERDSSSLAFRLSRIHVDSVIASARAKRFHAARSFG
jgi:hypothetical protein